MATEIERKFLVVDDDWQAHAAPGVRYRQGYLANSARASIRVRLGGDRAWLNLKGATLGVSRQEFEYPIPVGDAERILETFCVRPWIDKTRYLVEHQGHQWEVDVFAGDNQGLVVAEIELGAEDEHFEHPPWLGEEVSGDPRYYNARLVEHPYKDW